jgi:urate oxidase
VTIELGANRYGKSTIRIVKVIRGADRHRVRDLTVSVTLEGAFAAAHVAGDNSAVVATDTMKNTVYALAREHLIGPVEGFALELARHFGALEQVSTATVAIDEHRWRPLPLPEGEARDAFERLGDYTRTATVTVSQEGATVLAGLRDLAMLKTSRSSFRGFPRDEYTTLPETDDRIMATLVNATWRYTRDARIDDLDGRYDAIIDTILEVFADHISPSVQATIWIVGQAVLERHRVVEDITLRLPNLHHWLVDLSPFGQPNDREIFVATSEPFGVIEATVQRRSPAR